MIAEWGRGRTRKRSPRPHVTSRCGPSRRRRSLRLLGQFLEVRFHDRTVLGRQAAGQLDQSLGPFLLGQLAPQLGHFLDLLLIDLAGAVGAALDGVLGGAGGSVLALAVLIARPPVGAVAAVGAL